MNNKTTANTGKRTWRGLIGTAALVIGLSAGLAGGAIWHEQITHWLGLHGHDQGAEASAAAAEKPKQLWTCGMHPQVIQDRPGTCPICGMDLEPLQADGTAAGSGSSRAGHPAAAGAVVIIDPVVVQNMGVRVTPVTEGPLTRAIRAVGYLEEAQPNIVDVSLRVSGWIEKLHANTEGMHLKKGAPLFELYSPDVQVAVEELIVARRGLEAAGRAPTTTGNTAAGQSGQLMYDIARRKLLQMGLDTDQIEELSKLQTAPRTVQFVSPIEGHVTEKMVAEGAAVNSGEKVLRIVDHSTLWLDAQVHAQDLPFVRIGESVRAAVEGLPGREFEGKIIFRHPHVDPMTRTALFRMSIPNPAMELSPGMFATVRIDSTIESAATIIPREAVLDTGERQIAFVALPEGHFEPRRVKLGSSSDDGSVQVIEGLNVGEEVVTSGQFLLDSESRMREAIQKHLQKQLLVKADAPTAPQEQKQKQEKPSDASPEWAAAVDRFMSAYLAVSEQLGAVQTSDTPLDAAALASAAKALGDRAGSEKQKALAESLVKASQALSGPSLDEQREQFKAVSGAATALVQAYPPSKTVADKLYLWHCPMADASWLQTGAIAANPYYATTMKQCAELKQTVALQ